MDDPYAVDRRAFLKVGSAVTAAAAAGCAGPGKSWRVLTEQEAIILAAACDQIVPPDADPGAAAAGAVSFIDRQLATRRKRDLPRWRAGIRGLEATARRRHGRPYEELPFDTQTAVLRDVEKGAVEAADWNGVEPAVFFRLLLDHTMMGFYGDPRHGGNKDRASWKMLGVPDPPIRGQLREPTPSPPLAPHPPAAREG